MAAQGQGEKDGLQKACGDFLETEMFSMLTVVMISCGSTYVNIDLIVHVKYVRLIYFNYISIKGKLWEVRKK